jgi:hypothetical protein
MISTPPKTVARAAGAIIGAGLAATVLVAALPPAEFSRPPAKVSFAVPVRGELDVTPSAPHSVLASRALTPESKPAASAFRIRNQTGKTLRVGFRARAEARDLDGLLRVRLAVGDRQLADTTLQGLRHSSARTVRLPSGAARWVQIRAWLPRDVGDGYEGRLVDVWLVPVLNARG